MYIVAQGHSNAMLKLKDDRLKKYLHVLSSGWWVLAGKISEIFDILEDQGLLKNSRNRNVKYITGATATYYANSTEYYIRAVIDTCIGKVIFNKVSLAEYSRRYSMCINGENVTISPLDDAIKGVIIGKEGHRIKKIIKILYPHIKHINID